MVDIKWLELALEDTLFLRWLSYNRHEIRCWYTIADTFNNIPVKKLRPVEGRCNKLLYLCREGNLGFYILCNIHYRHFYDKNDSNKIGLIGRKELFTLNTLK